MQWSKFAEFSTTDHTIVKGVKVIQKYDFNLSGKV